MRLHGLKPRGIEATALAVVGLVPLVVICTIAVDASSRVGNDLRHSTTRAVPVRRPKFAGPERAMLNIARLTAALIPLIAFLPSLAFAQATKAGVVTTLEGHVTVTRVTLAPQPLQFKDDVFFNDAVTTGDQSIARMLLGGKAVVTVRERSTLTITEVPGKATIGLDAGKIALAVAKDKMRPGESIEIRAANVVAGIRGTVVVAEISSASAQAGGPTATLWVLRGKIEAFLADQPGHPVLVG